MFVFIQKGVFQKVRSLRRGREGVIEKQTKTNRGRGGGGGGLDVGGVAFF